MFGRRYFGGRYWGPGFFGPEAAAGPPGDGAGGYFGRRHFGGRYWGARYWGAGSAAEAVDPDRDVPTDIYCEVAVADDPADAACVTIEDD